VNELEKLRYHLKRGFENELTVNEDGITSHVDTINHCMLYAFGEYIQEYQTHCTICDQLFVLIEYLIITLLENF